MNQIHLDCQQKVAPQVQAEVRQSSGLSRVQLRVVSGRLHPPLFFLPKVGVSALKNLALYDPHGLRPWGSYPVAASRPLACSSCPSSLFFSLPFSSSLPSFSSSFLFSFPSFSFFPSLSHFFFFGKLLYVLPLAFGQRKIHAFGLRPKENSKCNTNTNNYNNNNIYNSIICINFTLIFIFNSFNFMFTLQILKLE